MFFISYHKKTQRASRGFTFIELMVAVSIIGMLSTIILTAAAGTRKSARVAQRVADMKRVQSALELYYANNRAYPLSQGNTFASVCPAWGGLSQNAVIPGLVPDYINIIPVDPQTKPGSNQNCYIYISNGIDYAFLDHDVTELYAGPGATYSKYKELIDPGRDSGPDNSLVDGVGIWSWKVYSAGAATY